MASDIGVKRKSLLLSLQELRESPSSGLRSRSDRRPRRREQSALDPRPQNNMSVSAKPTKEEHLLVGKGILTNININTIHLFAGSRSQGGTNVFRHRNFTGLYRAFFGTPVSNQEY